MDARAGTGGPSIWDRVRPREPLADLPSLGFPTPEEIRQLREQATRARGTGGALTVGREARLASTTWQGWGEHLIGEDNEWALRAVRYLKHILRLREEMIIERALRSRMGWDAIGAILGVSRQAVAQRWGWLAERVWQEEARASSTPPRSTSPGRPVRPGLPARKNG